MQKKPLVECAYDYRGRRCTKKVTVAGTVTLHQCMARAINRRCLFKKMALVSLLFGSIFFSGMVMASQDFFYINNAEQKKIFASEKEVDAFEKIYSSRTIIKNFRGSPPAPLFYYTSKKYRKSFTVFPSMMWVDDGSEQIDGEEERYFRVDRDSVETFLRVVADRK